jgi:hypothetical protein
MRLPPRAFLVWIGIIAIVAIVAFARNTAETPPDELASFPDLLNKLTNNLIVPGSGPRRFWPAIDRHPEDYRQILRQGSRWQLRQRSRRQED